MDIISTSNMLINPRNVSVIVKTDEQEEPVITIYGAGMSQVIRLAYPDSSTRDREFDNIKGIILSVK